MHNAISTYKHHYLLENRENGTKIALYSRRYVTTTRMYEILWVALSNLAVWVTYLAFVTSCFINFKVPPDVRIPLGHLVKTAAKFKPLFGEMSERFFLVPFKISVCDLFEFRF